MTTVLDVLKDAYHLLDDPKRWTQGAGARDSHGEKTNPKNLNAVSWCASGALYKAGAGDLYHSRGCRLDDSAWWYLANELVPCPDNSVYGMDIPRVNDGPDGYQLIREGLRRAIAKLETEQLEAIPVAEPSPELITV